MPQTGSRAHLARLGYEGFRGLVDAEIWLSPGLTLLHGRNGQGKSSLLEAIYVLGTTKSFRTGQQGELVRSDAPEARLAGRVEGAAPDMLGLRLRRGAPVKELVRCGRQVSAASYLGALHPIAFTVDSRFLVRGAPGLRRSFIDRGVAASRPGYLSERAAFRRALSQKARLLGARASVGEIEAWNAELGRRAAAVSSSRAAWVVELKKSSGGFREGVR